MERSTHSCVSVMYASPFPALSRSPVSIIVSQHPALPGVTNTHPLNHLNVSVASAFTTCFLGPDSKCERVSPLPLTPSAPYAHGNNCLLRIIGSKCGESAPALGDQANWSRRGRLFRGRTALIGELAVNFPSIKVV